MSSWSFWKTNGYFDFTHEGQVKTLADFDNWIIEHSCDLNFSTEQEDTMHTYSVWMRAPIEDDWLFNY